MLQNNYFKCMVKHRKANSLGQDSAVHLHLKDNEHSFEDISVHTLAKKDWWIKSGVKEVVYIKLDLTHVTLIRQTGQTRKVLMTLQSLNTWDSSVVSLLDKSDA